MQSHEAVHRQSGLWVENQSLFSPESLSKVANCSEKKKRESRCKQTSPIEQWSHPAEPRRTSHWFPRIAIRFSAGSQLPQSGLGPQDQVCMQSTGVTCRSSISRHPHSAVPWHQAAQEWLMYCSTPGILPCDAAGITHTVERGQRVFPDCTGICSQSCPSQEECKPELPKGLTTTRVITERWLWYAQSSITAFQQQRRGSAQVKGKSAQLVRQCVRRSWSYYREQLQTCGLEAITSLNTVIPVHVMGQVWLKRA